ncbi:hypothetical protein D3C74_429950 [compost metagenome]
MPQQLGAEFLNCHFAVQKVDDVGDPAAYGFGTFRFELLRIGMQRSLYVVQV